MSVVRFTARGAEPAGDRLGPILESLRARASALGAVKVDQLLDFFDAFGSKILSDERTRNLEGLMFLSAWLQRRNLSKLLELNLGGKVACLDGFQPDGRGYLAARPQGLVAMWMAGNVATLPMFSLVPALLAKNVCLVKLAAEEPEGMDRLLAVLAETETAGLRGTDLLETMAVVWFDYRNRALNEAMSLAADAKIVWGGAEAIAAISALPRHEHCVEVVFGPKYSIGVIDRRRLEGDRSALEAAVAGFVRDVAVFDQRACSAPQTIFIEHSDEVSLADVGRLFADQLSRLPPKPGLDAYTTMRILNVRAEHALDDRRDVIASADGANWTVCLDRQATMKEAVQSRTIFLSEIGSWREILPLLSPKIQTVGCAFADGADALAFAEAATAAGVVRCVRPGIMNVYESPWDGKLLVNQLVRWVVLKP
ncbi:MAG: acyl-CoA reductase [Planctomycetota bacterium]